MSQEYYDKVNQLIADTDSDFNYRIKETAVVLAAGHGKRIKSQTSKMLHKIYEKPTVSRVYEACEKGLENVNNVLVVGIKADEVIEVIGKRENTVFAFQQEQNGTGHAVQVGLQKIDSAKYDGVVYVLPGDMGLINPEAMKDFKDEFIASGNDMMVLTGLYEGDPLQNYYGRIVRVKAEDIEGNPSGEDEGKVIEIIENKDIHSLPDNEPHILNFNGKQYSFTKEELINNNEFNSGVFAFRFKPLVKHINSIESNNVQKEIYVTDMIAIFNNNGLSVGAVSPKAQYVLMGFNNKSVLKEMNAVARNLIYEKIKDIIEIDDPDDFYIAEDVVEQIIEMDAKGIPLDIKIGKGVFIGPGTKLNYNLSLYKHVYIKGNITFGEGVKIYDYAQLSCFPNQYMVIGNNAKIYHSNFIKGNLRIGDNSIIESRVNLTGSDEAPMIIGNNVTIKGSSYLYGSIVEDDLFIEHSIILERKIERKLDESGNIRPVRFFLPAQEGIEVITSLK